MRGAISRRNMPSEGSGLPGLPLAERAKMQNWMSLMADEEIHNRIEELVAEEHDLYTRAGEGGLSEDEHRRLESIKVGLDQCWDLLRQRRALREAGRDPTAAHERDPEVVERYEQ
jgi:hypothetical protein